jgi:hypothetical protein
LSRAWRPSPCGCCPHYLAFFNVLAGGPANGPAILADSNIDWGQDAKNLAAWLNARHVSQVCLDYFGTADIGRLGVRGPSLPATWETGRRASLDCVGAISTNILYDAYSNPRQHAWLRALRPVARIGYSIYIYDLRRQPTWIRPDENDRVPPWRRPIPWLSAALFILNAAIAWRIFHVEYLSQTGTGVGVIIAYARYARDHWPDFDWCRFWYAGLPFRNAYVPGVPLAAAFLSGFAHIGAGRAFYIVVACMYCLGPVTLFWMAFRLTRAASWSFYAGLLYSLVSPSAFLVPIYAGTSAAFLGPAAAHHGRLRG